ncbi:hypothetical protein DIU31_023990 [Mucilaginibacter rubeus]|uniref:Uncharacterized protein n=1 Tax=Mucilaginibacter rubeus TaxID=2027860 RepID=A0AAE6MKF4_9SPHI|nr:MULTISPECIES: hypothetical protein [Mucilaginibacter]QEM06424.1 hypothetical protein DIU31_023990 [Mucilaginibacter rubeus]QEM19008.1 hypothetical protein DIU38_024220 [Mucilaginibacter gossypii]QTE44451.1 hypothetical protein J3L19_03485 [Mucilaginibacter rubeus]QTE51050.1 hypothetical protein J3L21_03460 [Mucilaginibacter rubeus]QTE56133.1 hypothetical protein J3L23_28700 [Mucilaginibacter rubeus]
MMTINDIIVLLTLIIALIAIINEKNRTHLLLKFTKLDRWLFGLALVLINYFVFYQDFEQKDWVIHSLYFHGFGLHQPRHWAYIITLISLIYLFYKIYGSFYAKFQIEKVNAFYSKQIENLELSFLIDLIERYHKNDIIQWVSKNPVNNDDSERELEIDEPETWQVKVGIWWTGFIAGLFPLSWNNRSTYARRVLHSIINTPGFICHAANLRPYFFPEIYMHLTAAQHDQYPDELINSFFNELLRDKNYWLKKELKASESFDTGQPIRFHEENKILSGLLEDLTVSAKSKIWQSFGDTAVHELQEEIQKGLDSPLYQEYFSDNQLWEFKTQFSYQFFKILIIEAINKQHNGQHFWLFYYDRIIEKIIKAWEKNPPVEDVSKTVGHKFIENIFDTLQQWLEFANEKEHTGLYCDITSCIGRVLQVVNESAQYPEKDKIRMLDILFRTYCNLADNGQTDTLRTELEKVIKKPNNLVEAGFPYYGIVAKAWDQFDKVPHRVQDFTDYAYFGRFKRNVIQPLGLPTNTH